MDCTRAQFHFVPDTWNLSKIAIVRPEIGLFEIDMENKVLLFTVKCMYCVTAYVFNPYIIRRL